MNFDVDARTILKVKHGSHAYGLATPTSDLDIKGICIEPKEFHYGYIHHFEQHERTAAKGHDADLVIYSLKKFAKLAADNNPAIIEVLWGADEDILFIDEFGEELRAAKRSFLSKKARFTFSGYAHAQLKRIKTHRAWLLNPPKAPPNRKDFGLSETERVSKSEIGAGAALFGRGAESPLAMLEAGVPANVVTLFVKEREYQSAKTHYDQYVNWVKTRNPVRAAGEAKWGFDVKHGSHLIRLMRMCKEILVLGEVIVKRPDREDLLAIKHGERTYDSLIEEAERLETECDALYVTSTIPQEPNHTKLNALIVDMTDRYLHLYG